MKEFVFANAKKGVWPFKENSMKESDVHFYAEFVFAGYCLIRFLVGLLLHFEVVITTA